MPDPPRIQETGRSAWYRPYDDLIQMPPLRSFKSPESYHSTLFHELGHATGHARRLNSPGVIETVQFGSGVYSKEELVAELISAFCCATVALDNSVIEDAASNIDGWLKVLKSDPKGGRHRSRTGPTRCRLHQRRHVCIVTDHDHGLPDFTGRLFRHWAT